MRNLVCLLGLNLAMFMNISAADLTYTLDWLTPNTHTYLVSLEVAPSSGALTEFMLPTWRPGRYILQDYAAAVSHVEVVNEKGEAVSWRKTTPSVWSVENGDHKRLKITYRYFANNRDAGSSYYAPGQAYFNPINLFMYVKGRMNESVQMTVPALPQDWKIATALKRGSAFNVFEAADYHEFADSPTVFGAEMKQLEFEDEGTTFYLHFHGKYKGDEKIDQAIVKHVKAICQEQAAIFGSYPFEEYHFIYRLLPLGIRHAVEHTNSASFALPENVTASEPQVISGLCGITSHEFWHAWNVKRIRPAALWPYDYGQPQYTGLHWFTEGVTDYYTNLTLIRAGIRDEAWYFKVVARTLTSLENSYAARIVSPDQSSFNSWLATSPYQHPNHQTSYYSLGSRLGFWLDMEIRQRTNGKKTLDDVFRHLYKTYYQAGQGVPEDGIQKALEKLSGDSWAQFFQDYVYGTKPMDYKRLLRPMGLELVVSQNEQPGKRGIGLSRMEKLDQGMLIRRVSPGSDAYEAGLGPDDIILEVNGAQATSVDFDALVNGMKKGQTITMQVLANFSEVKEIQVPYTGRSIPKKMTLERSEKAKKQQASLRQDWLSPANP
ncbi:MAG: PDZ domain-containing protein [Bacteroidota bacterium]